MTALVIPVGSYEQHGPHLPPDTDSIIATHIATAIVNLIPDLMLGPVITVSASGEHAGFANTLSIGSEALTTILVELIRSADWSDGVILVNGHGGNERAISKAIDIATSEGRRAVAWFPRLADGDPHAGHSETSIMLAIDRGNVRMLRAEAGNTAPLVELMPRIIEGGIKSVSHNGVLGDPTLATREEGREILGGLIVDAVRTVENWMQ